MEHKNKATQLMKRRFNELWEARDKVDNKEKLSKEAIEALKKRLI